jgi:20S proteasome alpha/beta subunit
MSIIISLNTPEGIVLAAESRQTSGIGRIGSDFASKLFQLTPKIAVSTCGWGFLIPQSSNVLTSIGAVVEDIRAGIDQEISVKDAANKLSNHFQEIYKYDIDSLKWIPPPSGGNAVIFHIAGYSSNSTIGEIYKCVIPPGDSNLINAPCIWDGQIDVISRLVLGFDPRIHSLQFAQHLVSNPIPNQPNLATQLSGLQYNVNFLAMTMQDAVDFAVLMVKSTINMQRFSDGLVMAPGAMPVCGGDIDVAVITHRDGFKWLKKKELRIE